MAKDEKAEAALRAERARDEARRQAERDRHTAAVKRDMERKGKK